MKKILKFDESIAPLFWDKLENDAIQEIFDLICLNEMWGEKDEEKWLYLAESDIFFYVYKAEDGYYYRL